MTSDGFDPQSRQQQAGWRPGLFAWLLGLFFLGLTDVQVIPVLLPAFEKTFSVHIATAGSLVTLYAIAAAISALVIGPLSDRYGRMRFIRAAAAIFALAAILAAMAHTFSLMAVARLLAGLAGGVFSACIVALIADQFHFERRGRAMGWVAGMYSLSAVVGVPAGAFVSGTAGWPMIFWTMGLVSLVIALILPPLKDSAASVPSSPSLPRRFFQEQLAQYAGFWRRTGSRRGLWLAVAMVSATTSLITYLAAWLVDDFEYTMQEVGLVFLITGSAMVVGSVIGGGLADRLGKRASLALWSGLLIPVLLGVPLIQSRTSVLLFCLAGGFLLSLREAPYQAMITELVPAEQRGAYLALRSTAAKLAIAVSAFVAGHVFEHLGFRMVAVLAAACSFAALVLAFLLRLPPEQQPPPQAL